MRRLLVSPPKRGSSVPVSDERCPDCGALVTAVRTCRSAFDELLAFEFITPEAFGPVHHLTVACYYLQHPTGHGEVVRARWLELLKDPDAGRAGAVRIMADMRAAFDGATRVREAGAEAPVWWPRRWRLTALDALPPKGEAMTAEGHVRRVSAWAEGVREEVERRERTPPSRRVLG